MAAQDGADAVEELPPSRLGTKEHWDAQYEREVRVFEDCGDEGEVWFGESSVTKMRQWALKHLAPSSTPVRVLECGSGNGTLLLSFLTSPADYPPQAYHLTGIDYSPSAATLARSVEAARREAELDEDEEILNPCEVDWRVGDLLRDAYDETWDLVMDKGTYDALCLSSEPVQGDGRLPSQVYPDRVAALVRPGGYFLITSCNFTEEEIKRQYTRPGLGFEFHSSVPHKSFVFGGKQGQTVCTVAFRKTSETVPNGPNGSKPEVAVSSSKSEDEDKDKLFLCVDSGGTKTEVVVASSSRGIVARGVGGTGNMAEVGVKIATNIIISTVLATIAQLGSGSSTKALVNGNGTALPSMRCPKVFGDVWIGMSGCDSPADQRRLSEAVSPFFGSSRLSVLNDAHLLGGALLQKHRPWGISIIAGTGSVVVALEVDSAGDVVQIGRRGGHGYLLGDDGSAFDIGRCAIRAVVDDFDAGLEQSGGLSDIVKKHFGATETGEVLGKVHDLDNKLRPVDAANVRKLRISSLARYVLEAYARTPPDLLAKRAIWDATTPLVASVVSLIRQLVGQKTLTGQPRRKVEDAAVIMAGGVIRQPAYRDLILDRLREKGVVFVMESVVDDVAGEAVMGLVERAQRRCA